MRLSGPAALAVTLSLCSGAVAQYHVGPNTHTSLAGQTGNNTLLRDQNEPRTYQVRLLDSELDLTPGDRIEAIGLRLSTLANLTESWPPIGGATWGDYEITLSEDANPAIPLSTTFASNMLNPVKVRDGALTIPAGAFTVGATPWGATPNAWGYEIVLDEAYEYAGGNLIVTVRHTGSNLIPDGPYVDAEPLPGRAVWTDSFSAVSGQATSAAAILRLRTADEGSVVVPSRFTHAAAPANANTLTQPGPRTVQFQYAASELGGLQIGEIITGISIRGHGPIPGGSWPGPGGASFAAYEITLAQAALPVGSMSTSFAGNQVNPRLVRSGPLEIPAGTFTEVSAGAEPTAYWEIPISPYQYMGGDLVVTVSHTGQASGTTLRLDGLGGASTTTRWLWQDQYQAQSGTINLNSVTPSLRFTRRPAFGPGVLWDNGPIVNRPGQGFGGADLSQVTAPHSGMGVNASSADSFRVADEVHINEPGGWALDRIDVMAFTTGDTTGNPSLLNGGTVRVWDGVPNSPGSSIVAQSSAMVANDWTGAYRAFTSSPLASNRPVRRLGFAFPAGTSLPRGTYYVDQTFAGPAVGAFVVPVQHFGGHKAGDGLRRNNLGVWGPSLDVASGRQVEFPFVMLGSVRQCRADLSTGAVPGQPGYGIANGVLNNDDFFYFLAQFAAGNIAVADLTTGAVSGQPGYGVPNGVINNDDFFYYLAIFAAGC